MVVGRICSASLIMGPRTSAICFCAGSYATRERFLSELTLDPPEATSARAIRPPA